jgi:hypothetical protein
MRHLLSKCSLPMRLRTGGVSFLNLSNLSGYIVYPGPPQIPADSWIANPVANTALISQG